MRSPSNFYQKFFFLFILCGIFALFWVFHDDLKDLSREWVDRFGLVALILLTIVADSLIQPIPPDVFVFGSAFGGGSPIEAAIAAGFASSLGGMIGYSLARVVGPWRFRRLFGRALFHQARGAIKRHGVFVLVVGALTPLPYSASCWVAGLYRMPPWVVFLTSLLSRIPRFLVVAYLGSLL